MKNIITKIITFLFLSGSFASAQIAGGGNFTLDQSVIGSGGGKSAGGNFVVEGTNAQAIAGTRSSNPTTGLHSGFWNDSPLVPTAATVSVSGRVVTAEGQGIRNVAVTLTKSDGTIQTAVTGSFGFYNFAEIETGQTVIISVRAKRFTFQQPTIVLNIAENASEINFTGHE